jgi:hypothetical protein
LAVRGSENRALLVSLEEDRKTISRLSHDSGKLVAASATLKHSSSLCAAVDAQA